MSTILSFISDQRIQQLVARPKLKLIGVNVIIDEHHQFKYQLETGHTLYTLIMRVLRRDFNVRDEWLLKGDWFGSDGQQLSWRLPLGELQDGQCTFQYPHGAIRVQLSAYNTIDTEDYANESVEEMDFIKS